MLLTHDNVHLPMQEGLTALILATQKGRSDIITVLMDANADPNITDKVGSVITEWLHTTSVLLFFFLAVDIQTYGWSAVFFAAKMGNLKVVQQLISRGATVDLKDKVIWTVD